MAAWWLVYKAATLSIGISVFTSSPTAFKMSLAAVMLGLKGLDDGFHHLLLARLCRSPRLDRRSRIREYFRALARSALLPLLKVVPFISEGERVVDGDPTNGVNHLSRLYVDHGVVINRYAE